MADIHIGIPYIQNPTATKVYPLCVQDLAVTT